MGLMDKIKKTASSIVNKDNDDGYVDTEVVERKQDPAHKRHQSSKRAVTTRKAKNNRKMDIAAAYKAIIDKVV
jgi:hypothetical protein